MNSPNPNLSPRSRMTRVPALQNAPRSPEPQNHGIWERYWIWIVAGVFILGMAFSGLLPSAYTANSEEYMQIRAELRTLQTQVASFPAQLDTVNQDVLALQLAPPPVVVTEPTVPAAPVVEAPAVVSGPDRIVSVAEEARRAVVTVHTEDGQGSGFVIHPDGYVVTNQHVVEDFEAVAIQIANGEIIPADVVAADKFADIAVVKMEMPLPYLVKWGDSDKLKLGQTVMAIGSPEGYRNTVTVGVVSGIGRNEVDEMDDTIYNMENLVQTDAAINSGNSGGPLVDLDGNVIGVNVMKIVAEGIEGFGFAIPANIAKIIVDEMITTGDFSRPFIGIAYTDIYLDEEIIDAYDFPVFSGARIDYVERNSPAEQAGLRVDDIIVRVGLRPIPDDSFFMNLLYQHKPGDTIQIDYYRAGKRLTTDVTLTRQR